MLKLMPRRHGARLTAVAAVALVVPAVLAGCSSSGDSATSSAAATSAAAAASSEAAAPASSAAAAGSAVADLVPEAIKTAGVLRVALPDASAPLSSVNADGQVEGMDPDLANAVGELMGLQVEFTPGTFDSQIPGLLAGKFDVAMGEYYVTAERLESVDFVTDWRDYSSFATKADSDYAPETGQDLCGKIVGVLKGSAEEASVTTLNESCDPKMEISSFPDAAAGLLALDSGRVDVVVNGRGQLELAMAENPNLKVSGEFGGGPTATAVARTEYSAEMLEALRAAFQELMDNGTYQTILDKWGAGYGATDMAEIYTADSTPPNYSAV